MTEKELRGKIKHEIEFLAEHWTTDDVEPFNFGGWKEEVLDEIMQLIQQRDGELKSKLEAEIIIPANSIWGKRFNAGINKAIQLVQQQGVTPTEEESK